MCTDGDKSEETKTPKSRHELNTGTYYSRVCAFVCAMLKNISSMKPVSNMSFPKLSA